MDIPVPDEEPPTTVMGPVGSLSGVNINNGNNPPLFFTGTTIKKRVADDLRMWMEMMEAYYTNDKHKIELTNAGYKIYWRCDEQARDIMEKSRASEDRNHRGDN